MEMMLFTSRSGLYKLWVHRLFFHQDPGLRVLQCGQRGSSALINFLQLGQSMECLF